MAILIVVALVAITFVAYGRVYREHTFEGVSYRCYFKATEVYEGEEIVFVEELTNAKALPIPWLKAELTTSKYLEFSERCSAVTYKSRFVSSSYAVGAHKSVRREWKLHASKRGVFSIESVVLNACDVFGLNEVSKHLGGIDATVTVLPLEVSTPQLDAYVRGMVGELQTQRSLLTDVFSMRGIREYTGHERLNRIHWKASAKQGKLVAIEEDYTTSMDVVVYLYIDERCEESLAEKALSTACTVAVRLSESGINTQIDTNCGSPSVKSFGSAHALNLKRFCAELELSPNGFAVPSVNPNSTLVLVTPASNRETFANFETVPNRRLCLVSNVTTV